MFRQDRGAKGDGVPVVYGKKEISFIRRSDLEIVMAMVGNLVFKSRSFLIGTNYRSPTSSSYHDNKFILWKLQRGLRVKSDDHAWMILIVFYLPNEIFHLA